MTELFPLLCGCFHGPFLGLNGATAAGGSHTTDISVQPGTYTVTQKPRLQAAKDSCAAVDKSKKLQPTAAPLVLIGDSQRLSPSPWLGWREE